METTKKSSTPNPTADSSFSGGKSLSEAMGVRRSLLGPKYNIKIGNGGKRVPMDWLWTGCQWDTSITVYRGHDSTHTHGVAPII